MNSYSEDMKIVQAGLFNDEGYETEEEYLQFWQALVNTGLAWQLEGWYGRTAASLIEQGLITVPEN